MYTRHTRMKRIDFLYILYTDTALISQNVNKKRVTGDYINYVVFYVKKWMFK